MIKKIKCIALMFFISSTAFSQVQQEISKQILPATEKASELECSANLQPTVDQDKIKLSKKLAAELNNKQDWFVSGEKQKFAVCYINHKKALLMVEKEAALLVDIRDAADYDQLKIPGSINIPTKLLKSKTFLKSKSIVLIDNGTCYAHLENLCQSLRKTGFQSVHILKEGLLGWHDDVQSLQGNRLALTEMETIQPENFYSEKAYAHWLLIDVSEKPIPRKSVYALPTEQSIFNDQATQRDWLTKLQKIVKKKAKSIGEQPIVMFIDHTGKRSEQVLVILRKTRKINNTEKSSPKGEAWVRGNKKMLPNFFVSLKGGINGYEKFLRNRFAMLSYEPVLNKNRGCGE